MPTALSRDLRKLLEKTIAGARVLAQRACRAALENLAVHEKEPRPHMAARERLLRDRLRSRGRALGDIRDDRTGLQEIRRLGELAAYEQWHRLLFLRFLTENDLLISPGADGLLPVTLEDCEQLASGLGARDGLDLACRLAGLALPGVFRRADPVLELPIAPSDQAELRSMLRLLPTECFRADDALGWTYQFWQAPRKAEINKSGKKIGADELSPVTQLFTEDYLVEFLLHNTLGAWWAGKSGPVSAASEEEARAQVALVARDGIPAVSWSYLRFSQDQTTKSWLPAAGTFDAWPKSARLIRLIDPCMGSGHFLVSALPLLVRLRLEEENIPARACVISVVKENIHGLELDERCTQIAAFNVALTAWKLAGYQALPPLHLACSGLAPSTGEAQWAAPAGDDDRLSRGMKRLHAIFSQAPVLGSLINPRVPAGELAGAEFHELAPLLAGVLAADGGRKGNAGGEAAEPAVSAQGLSKAAELLAGQFTLVVTNVPFLRRGSQCGGLRAYLDDCYPEGRADLATAFLQRAIAFLQPHGTSACVSQQHFLYLGSYRAFRNRLLSQTRINFLVRLGPGAFETIAGENVTVSLSCLTQALPAGDEIFPYCDAQSAKKPKQKAELVRSAGLTWLGQKAQTANPDSRIGFTQQTDIPLLQRGCGAFIGLQNGDSPRFILCFWEVASISFPWDPFQLTSDRTLPFGGRDGILRWEGGKGELAGAPYARIQGAEAWGHKGVAVRNTVPLPVTLYSGELYDQSSTAIIPRDPGHLEALWAFCSSAEFSPSIQLVDAKRNKTNQTFLKIPFDLAHWQGVAAERFPGGLPGPQSDDPAQWLFSGHPEGCGQPLHAALLRLLGYRWPRQTGSGFPDCPALGPDGLEAFAGAAGIVCLAPLGREQSAAARLRQILAAALGSFDERALVAAAGRNGSRSETLEEWLRDEFFEQHARLCKGRPFIWHIWDGRSDGFHALVNYHTLGHATLQKLSCGYLGDWIAQQSGAAKADKPGAAGRLGAARALQAKLAAILAGEAPLDIFVRWKPLNEQAVGWHPDLNDGVRQNIRPFLLAGDMGKRGAGLFRAVPLALKERDRGAEPQCPKREYPWYWCEAEPGRDPAGGKDFVGKRWNNVHLTLEVKMAARDRHETRIITKQIVSSLSDDGYRELQD